MRILLVEDSSLIRDAVVETLSDNPAIQFDGFATTQDDAIALLEERPFDLLLVDIELAKGNGFEVLKAVNSEGFSHPRPVCIMFTNHAYNYYRTQAKALGVEHFFDKSMDFDLTIETIEAVAAQKINKHNSP
ncbi:MAG TPA: response regulator [Methylophilaceae bacterium]|nr:response regulator [Methylophilaceae bacterium]